MDKNSNGRVNLLLWLNTLLTALILPLLGFIGVRLWDGVDANSKDIARVRNELAIVKERQNQVLTTLPKLVESDEKFNNQLAEHLKQQALKTLP